MNGFLLRHMFLIKFLKKNLPRQVFFTVCFLLLPYLSSCSFISWSREAFINPSYRDLSLYPWKEIQVSIQKDAALKNGFPRGAIFYIELTPEQEGSFDKQLSDKIKNFLIHSSFRVKKPSLAQYRFHFSYEDGLKKQKVNINDQGQYYELKSHKSKIYLAVYENKDEGQLLWEARASKVDGKYALDHWDEKNHAHQVDYFLIAALKDFALRQGQESVWVYPGHLRKLRKSIYTF